jgi:AraC-like DNA-binding protein
MKLSPEDHESISFVQWLEFSKYKFTHIANEAGFSGPSSFAVTRKKKRLGVSPGVPDFMILMPQGVVWVEMKTWGSKLKKGSWKDDWKSGQKSRGGVSLEQKEWIEAINATPGTYAEVCYGAIEAIAFVSKFNKPL